MSLEFSYVDKFLVIDGASRQFFLKLPCITVHMAKRGRPRRWPARFTAVMLPLDDRDHYETEAARFGLSLSSYLVWRLALQHGRGIPPELEAELRGGRNVRTRAQMDLAPAT